MLGIQDLTSGNLFNNGASKIELSPNYRTDNNSHGESDSPIDPMSQLDDRRPSLVSETTASSQNSGSKASTHRGAAHKKIAGFFGDDGRQSSRGSEVSNSLQRETTQSSHHGSMRSNYTDGQPVSPTSSRPRTPLQPSSDVTPWLFQDFKVCTPIMQVREVLIMSHCNFSFCIEWFLANVATLRRYVEWMSLPVCSLIKRVC